MKAGLIFGFLHFETCIFMKNPSKQDKVRQIAEILFKRIAAKNNDTLPAKFWNDERYARDYRLQLIKINAVMKVYEPQAIINALNSTKGKAIWSITAPWLDPLMAEEQKKLNRLNEQKDRFDKSSNDFADSIEKPLQIVQKEKIVAPKKKNDLEKLDG